MALSATQSIEVFNLLARYVSRPSPEDNLVIAEQRQEVIDYLLELGFEKQQDDMYSIPLAKAKEVVKNLSFDYKDYWEQENPLGG